MQKTLREITHWTRGKLVGGVSDPHLLVDGVSTDTRTLQRNNLYVPLKGERFDGHAFWMDAVRAGAAAALWNREVPLPKDPPIPLIQVEDTLIALQELAAGYRRELEVKVVGITGSNGKTTTKDLTAAILATRYRVHRTQGNLNNHIGLPLTLLSMPPDTEVAVVEMGMNHAGEIARLSKIAAPDLALVTNIGEAHLEFLGSRGAIADAKLEIREGMPSTGTLIIDGDEPLLRERLAGEERPVIRVGFGESNDDRILDLELKGRAGIAFTSSATDTRFETGLMGKHNALNALLGIQAARLLGLTETGIREGLKGAEGSGRRLETSTASNGMLVVDDSYNASPTAVRAAIDWLTSLEDYEEKWVLLGDMLELGVQEEALHREVGSYAVQQGIPRVFTLGERARWISEGARAAAPDLPVTHFNSVEEAVNTLRRRGGPGVAMLVKASLMARLDRVVQQLTKGEIQG
ncbi:UDP-N-acetylmuramoyl-tripeptide--D-alanyl-D-alanine ligase [Kroppenstedtia eburnea]|uniref:UDP-N-acetylmuramoyl-tripeptide--D-alanyl-D-alanine ligase n=1 Tax=Kroppenstedtia eburnea TaxID=714067 RepID=A0A1N7J4T5_9BACL|nr:UDP-N-acetylmuramoyl-tripeptide--D-alanyl-D-alanine ligase [Kroppenstedtia eburnea]EGK13148.1 UDP-N-acetylmuramoyl-tripeptide--D-alanyl-D-alanine ligase [Desmospora sp. 8437]QKI82506.1 UDP-N-acetylmuramoyl-tripeptide--D-alanyl-D-alanine ligase [Kroppenstedtia eburnea]SIS44350.1 UDP-N-acetylmuramoyl-tripeptide--D-alanyl-D-alanine ligase [Kroppenstedtia eburnea]